MKILLTHILSAALVLISACAPNQRIVNSSAEHDRQTKPTENSGTPRVTRVEDDMAAMKTADFNFVYVFRRKDGAEFDADDRAFFNANTPYEINRRKLSEGGKALVIGSNFRFPAENFKLLKERFAFEDFSKPENEIIPVNSSSNKS
ncbi:MAG: hypothetical protein ACRD6X_15290 [Pyrinomonadaceae bacterium]